METGHFRWFSNFDTTIDSMAPALLSDVMIIALIIIGLTAIGLVIGLVAASNAPVGYQDEAGFHFGPEYATATAQKEVAHGVRQPRFA